MKSSNIRIEILKAIVKASNQAYGNINCDSDLIFDRKDKRQLEKELVKDEKILALTKKYMGDNDGRRY